MGIFLSEDELAETEPAERAAYAAPIPTQVVSNGEYMPLPQSLKQRQVEARIKELGETIGERHGLSRRRFLKTSCGMAAAFLAMNQIYGDFYEVHAAETHDPEAAAERAKRFANQFIIDGQTHFMRDDVDPDSPLIRMVRNGRTYAQKYLDPSLKGIEQTAKQVQFENYVKEIFFDSDTKLALLSSASADNPDHWFLSNDQAIDARRRINELAGSRRLFAHCIFTPGQPGWLDEVDRAIAELKPDAWKGYTIGGVGAPSNYMWRLDDEKVVYPAYERMVKSGIRTVCVHKGLMSTAAEANNPGVIEHSSVVDVGQAAKDWPELNFVIFHAGMQYAREAPDKITRRMEDTGQIDWVNQLAEIPEKYGVNNVYADIGAVFGTTTITHPRYCAGLMGILLKGMGTERVLWGTDCVWYGSPQWQIEALRRMEIPQDLQKKFGWPALGPADGPVKNAIFAENFARLYGLDLDAERRATDGDRLREARSEYQETGGERSNLAYGYIARHLAST